MCESETLRPPTIGHGADFPERFRRYDTGGEPGLGSLVGNAGPTGIPLPLTQTEICVAEASKWLQTHADPQPEQPFCLSVNFDKPHFPVRCPERHLSAYERRVRVPGVPGRLSGAGGALRPQGNRSIRLQRRGR